MTHIVYPTEQSIGTVGRLRDNILSSQENRPFGGFLCREYSIFPIIGFLINAGSVKSSVLRSEYTAFGRRGEPNQTNEILNRAEKY